MAGRQQMKNEEGMLSHKIHTFLSNKHIIVQREWTEACIQWLEEEHKDANPSLDNYQMLVYEQWLMSDLRDIADKALPSHIQPKHFITLKEVYTLQVHYAYNIGASAYSQLQILKGNEIDEVTSNEQSEIGDEKALKNASKTFPNQPKWRKPTRMLLLELTDGFQEIHGIEYSPIPTSTDSITPGCKVQIKGPVTCRDGLLFLTANNFLILGGSCDDLLQKCNQMKIFKNILSIDNGDEEGVLNSEKDNGGRIDEGRQVEPSRNIVKSEIKDSIKFHTAEQGKELNTRRQFDGRNEAGKDGRQFDGRNEAGKDGRRFDGRNEAGKDGRMEVDEDFEDFFQDDLKIDEELNFKLPHKESKCENSHIGSNTCVQFEATHCENTSNDFGLESEMFEDEFDCDDDSLIREIITKQDEYTTKQDEITTKQDEYTTKQDEITTKQDVQVKAPLKGIKEVPQTKTMFLAEFMSQGNFQKVQTKAYIVTLLSKLDIKMTSYQLMVCIDDGSATAAVSISNQVLERLLQFKSAEIAKYKEESLPLPTAMKEAVIRCQQLLASTTWMMQISKNEGGQLTVDHMNEWTPELV